jgi:hypothetical protein
VGLSEGPLRLEKTLEASNHDSLSIIMFRTTYGRKHGQFRIRKRSRMDGDARIRWILNNGLEMVRKPVKTARCRGSVCSPSSRPSPGTIVERIRPRGRGLYKRFLEEALEYHRGAISLFWIGWRLVT